MRAVPVPSSFLLPTAVDIDGMAKFLNPSWTMRWPWEQKTHAAEKQGERSEVPHQPRLPHSRLLY